MQSRNFTDIQGIEWGWFFPDSGHNIDNIWDVIMPVQTHSSNVGILTDREQVFEDTDALITFCTDLRIGVRTADCVPILLYSPDIRAVAAVHSGWKGTLGRIVVNVMDQLVDFGADPVKMIAIIGNCICKECYEVSEELADLFEVNGLDYAVVRNKRYCDPLGIISFDNSKPHLDLAGTILKILLENGIQSTSVFSTENCTRHSSLNLPSYRREPGTTARQITWIKLV